MSHYRKPLKNGGSRIIGRGTHGRFARFTLGAEVCMADGCGAFILPEYVERDGFPSKEWPTKCHRCGANFSRS